MVRSRVVTTFQGHTVPDKAYRPGPIFDVSVLRQPEISTDYDLGEEGIDQFPAGATVLNRMQGLRYFRCNYCSDVVAENDLDSHDCPESRLAE
jgi:hypothetical protein